MADKSSIIIAKQGWGLAWDSNFVWIGACRIELGIVGVGVAVGVVGVGVAGVGNDFDVKSENL